MKRLIALLVLTLSSGACANSGSGAVEATTCDEWVAAWNAIMADRQIAKDAAQDALTKGVDRAKRQEAADELSVSADQMRQLLDAFRSLGEPPQGFAEAAGIFDREMEALVEALDLFARSLRTEDVEEAEEAASLLDEGVALSQELIGTIMVCP